LERTRNPPAGTTNRSSGNCPLIAARRATAACEAGSWSGSTSSYGAQSVAMYSLNASENGDWRFGWAGCCSLMDRIVPPRWSDRSRGKVGTVTIDHDPPPPVPPAPQGEPELPADPDQW